jgi:hypothetical protein
MTTLVGSATALRRSARTVEPVHVFNPVGFDPRGHLPDGLHRHGDCARYLLHRVHYGRVFGLHNKDGFVRLKADYVRPFFPGNYVYQQVRSSLIESGAIVCDNRYIEGEKSLGYKLGPEWSDMRQHKVAILNRKLANKIRANRQDWSKTPEGVHRHLLNCLRCVEIDYPAALDMLLGSDFEPSDETAIQLIRDREFFFHVCDYGRVHTNLTNLKSSMRPFLSYRGMPLVNLDIRNSQPLIFSILLMQHYGADLAMPPDVRRYVELCQAGEFYDYLMAEGGIAAERRQAFKRRFFGHVFFCKNWPETDAAKLFGQLFPNVYALVREQKERDYKALAKNLQRAESDLVVGGVAVRCMHELPRTFISTIHDSILTTLDQADLVLAIMQQEFGRVGLRPTIRVEPLSPTGGLGQL